MLNVKQRQNWYLNDIVEVISMANFIFFTASTMQEQRDIAEYICEKLREKNIGCRHIDYSKEEDYFRYLVEDDDPEILVCSNFQELLLGPYCKADDQATVTLDVKMKKLARLNGLQPFCETDLLQWINLQRDVIREKGKRTIFGMSPNFLDKMESPIYYPCIDDFLDYSAYTVRFEDPEYGEGMFEKYNEKDFYPMDAIFWLYNDKVVYNIGRKNWTEKLELDLSNAKDAQLLKKR